MKLFGIKILNSDNKINILKLLIQIQILSQKMNLITMVISLILGNFTNFWINLFSKIIMHLEVIKI